jgi:hypothetical protein
VSQASQIHHAISPNYHGPTNHLPAGVVHNPQHTSNAPDNWGSIHGHHAIIYHHGGHRYHRWYYQLAGFPGWYWYDTTADVVSDADNSDDPDAVNTDTDPAAVAAADQPDDSLPDCDPTEDECADGA